MNESGDNDAVFFDRLADGELSPTERRELLASLDDREDGWRRCALAFLESQSWRLQLKQLVAEPLEKRVIVTPFFGKTVAGGRTLSLLALAAGLLIAFTAGWLVRSPSASHNGDGPLAATIVEEKISSEEVAENFGPSDVVTLLVRDDQGQPQRLRVPLVDSAGLDQRLGTMQNSLPPGFLERLQQRGFDLESRRRYAPIYFEQNEQLVPMVVPVDDAYVVPVNRPVY